MLDSSNCLKGAYNQRFLSNQIGSIVKDIPEDRRKALAQEIEAKAQLAGCSNPVALVKALKKLREEIV